MEIYLASRSRARRKLLKELGIDWKVLVVRARERKSRFSHSFTWLAKINALEKARCAAKKVKSGVIIAADTICVQRGRIFGKPRDLREARKTLKSLSDAPQQLFTGLAVIDLDRKKELVDCEKTKIFMDKLSDKEISAYFRKSSPLGKAGSFDIQGRGAFFIRRIEGCFYNVVGLPVRRLYRMFKKLNLSLLIFLLCLFFGGCSTEYNVVTGEQEVYYYSTDREVQLGKSIAIQVEKEYKQADDPLMQKRVGEIGKRIAAVCDRKEIDYEFMVLEDDDVNAVSLPGGYVYIFRGLIDKVGSDDELAGVVAHEVGHIVARHSIKKLQALQGYSLLSAVLMVGSQSAEVKDAADAAFLELLLGYSREDELLADQLGARYSRLAGYDPQGMIKFLERLQEINRRKPPRPRSYFKTHPYAPDRIRVVKQELGQKIDFDDYINIEQKPHE